MPELSTLGPVIKEAYESQTNTNAFTDPEKAQVNGLSTVATSGNYADLAGKPPVIAEGETAEEARAAIGAISSSEKAQAEGVATLNSSGVVPLDQLNISGLTFHGGWDASANSPELLDGSGSVGDFYKVTTAGTHDFGNGSYTFSVGDWAIYAAGVWQRVGVHESVQSVNGQTGPVDLNAASVGALPASYTPSWEEITNKPNLDGATPGTISPPIPAVLAYKTSTQPTSNNNAVTVQWEDASYDQFGMQLNTTQFVVPDWASHLSAKGMVVFGGNEGGFRRAGILINGTVPPGAGHDQGGNVGAFEEARTIVTGAIPVESGDVVTVEAWQSLGGTTPLQASGNSRTWLQIDLHESQQSES